jgi:hypothetical protein
MLDILTRPTGSIFATTLQLAGEAILMTEQISEIRALCQQQTSG